MTENQFISLSEYIPTRRSHYSSTGELTITRHSVKGRQYRYSVKIPQGMCRICGLKYRDRVDFQVNPASRACRIIKVKDGGFFLSMSSYSEAIKKKATTGEFISLRLQFPVLEGDLIEIEKGASFPDASVKTGWIEFSLKKGEQSNG